MGTRRLTQTLLAPWGSSEPDFFTCLIATTWVRAGTGGSWFRLDLQAIAARTCHWQRDYWFCFCWRAR